MAGNEDYIVGNVREGILKNDGEIGRKGEEENLGAINRFWK